MCRLRRLMLAVALVAVAGLAGCAHTAPPASTLPAGAVPEGSALLPVPPQDAAAVAGALVGIPASPVGQLLVAVADGEGETRARLYLLERGERGWVYRGGPIAASIGRSGFSRPGEKREGDGHSPSGLFPLEFAFGYAPSMNTRMPYRQAAADDVWVDDPNSPDYNSWTKRGETRATSFEEMKRPDIYYRHGVVIGYNRYPVVKGAGSAIFLHIWRGDGKPTAGCVAIDEAELVGIIEWLDPAKRPMILMGNRQDLPVAAGELRR